MNRLKLNGTVTPAVVIIFIMILINAGVILYFANQFEQADADLRAQADQTQQLAKSNSKIIQEQAQERTIRSDQSCELFETDHLQDIQQLRQTYRYLVSLTAEERQQPLNRFILISLPQTEQQALIDRAPEYCDTKAPNGDDIGLPEPDPVVPDRPAQLVQIIGKRPNYPSPIEKQKKAKQQAQQPHGQNLTNK